MELFTIQCTTCKARLVVRDEAVIGDILSCPKCGSMVQVVPPVGWKRPGAGDSSPGELKVVAPAAAPPSASANKKLPAYAPEEASTKEKVAAAAAAIPPALPPRPAPQSTAAASPSEPLPAESATSEAVAAAAPVAPEATPTLLSAAVAWAKGDWILLTSGLAGGVVLGAAVWLVVAMTSTEPLEVADLPVAVTPPVETDDGQALPEEPVKSPAADKPEAVETAVPADALPDVPQVAVNSTPPAEPDEVESTATARPETPEPGSAELAPTAADEAETVEDAAPVESAPSLKLDPIRRTKSSLPVDLTTVMPSSAGNRPSEPRVPPESEPAVEATESLDMPAPLSSEQIDQRLAVVIAGVEFADVPLSQFAAFITDISGVPVTFDDAVLSKTGPGRTSPVSVKLTQTTAGEALRAAVKHLGLSIAIEDGRIVVTRGSK